MHKPTFIDLGHVVEHGIITYKGLPAPLICDYLSREVSKARYCEVGRPALLTQSLQLDNS
jgi:arylformamidase